MTIEIDDRFLVQVGDHFGFTDEIGFDLSAPGARLANEGLISLRIDIDGALLAPVLASGEDARFWNRGGAELRVDTTGTTSEAFAVEFAADDGSFINDGKVVVRGGQYARAITDFGNGFSLVNTGVIKVSAEDAVLAFARSDAAFFNSGLMHVQGDDATAVAVYSSALTPGSLINHGRISAEGVSGAVAIGLWDAAQGYSVQNDGRILATTSADGNPSRGIVLPGGGPGHVTIENAGVLSADVALWSIGGVNQVEIDNTGVIRGDIQLDDGTDHITNSGKIDGDVTLGGGADRYDGWRGNLHGDLVGNLGDDTLIGGRGDDRIWGDNQNSDFYDGDDQLAGARGNDFLYGGGGDDTLGGGQGDDTLVGGLGRDLLSGGSGATSFVFTSVEDSTNAAPDLILLFGKADVIDLSAIDADSTTDGDQAFHIVRAFTGAAGELVLTNEPMRQTSVEGDVDGDGQADFTIIINGWHGHATNFVL